MFTAVAVSHPSGSHSRGPTLSLLMSCHLKGVINSSYQNDDTLPNYVIHIMLPFFIIANEYFVLLSIAAGSRIFPSSAFASQLSTNQRESRKKNHISHPTTEQRLRYQDQSEIIWKCERQNFYCFIECSGDIGCIYSLRLSWNKVT